MSPYPLNGGSGGGGGGGITPFITGEKTKFQAGPEVLQIYCTDYRLGIFCVG